MNDVNCKHSNEIVPYMYGELARSATSEFEAHLLECQVCTDEFAAMSAARYEVYDWKKLEFDPLATPAIEIPFGDVVAVSWIEKLRAAFAGSWAMPASALASVAIVLAIVALFVVSRDQVNELAQEKGNVLANDNTNTRKSAPQTVVNEPPAAPRGPAADPEREAPRPTVVKDTPATKRPVNNQPTTAPRSSAPRQAAKQTPPVPRLNDFAEEEDNSLRLAELFEDIDTSE